MRLKKHHEDRAQTRARTTNFQREKSGKKKIRNESKKARLRSVTACPQCATRMFDLQVVVIVERVVFVDVFIFAVAL